VFCLILIYSKNRFNIPIYTSISLGLQPFCYTYRSYSLSALDTSLSLESKTLNTLKIRDNKGNTTPVNAPKKTVKDPSFKYANITDSLLQSRFRTKNPRKLQKQVKARQKKRGKRQSKPRKVSKHLLQKMKMSEAEIVSFRERERKGLKVNVRLEELIDGILKTQFGVVERRKASLGQYASALKLAVAEMVVESKIKSKRDVEFVSMPAYGVGLGPESVGVGSLGVDSKEERPEGEMDFQALHFPLNSTLEDFSLKNY
jgi:hypothetical protein